MLTCKEVSVLMSDSLDKRLPLRKRFQVKFHWFMCKNCARYSDQLNIIRRIARKYGEQLDDKALSLFTIPENARHRIIQNIENYLKK